VLEDRVLRGIVGLKEVGGNGVVRRCITCVSSLRIIGISKSRKMRWVGHA
jgi:hypothetical protein